MLVFLVQNDKCSMSSLPVAHLQVLVCPPAACLAPPFEPCPEHVFATFGLRGCQLDTASAPEGKLFTVEFAVVGAGDPGATLLVITSIHVLP